MPVRTYYDLLGVLVCLTLNVDFVIGEQRGYQWNHFRWRVAWWGWSYRTYSYILHFKKSPYFDYWRKAVQDKGLKTYMMKQVMLQTYETAKDCIQTNYYGTKHVTEALLPFLCLSTSPRIVNISSGLGKLEVSYGLFSSLYICVLSLDRPIEFNLTMLIWEAHLR